jgi:hypothetical protein
MHSSVRQMTNRPTKRFTTQSYSHSHQFHLFAHPIMHNEVDINPPCQTFTLVVLRWSHAQMQVQRESEDDPG